MIGEDLKRIRRDFKERSIALRNREQYDRAVATLDQALQELQVLKPDGASEEGELRAEIADTYGITGGVYRRAGETARALDAYRNGAAEEEKDRASTYNLSNVITLEITFEKRSPEDPEVRKQIDAAIERLELATVSGRQDEWWAWFDLGQSYLLRGTAADARRCYERAIATGPRADDIERHVQILEELREATKTTAPQISRDIELAIEFLRTHID
jgi:tetratricopeptide (TPR) repeat protein